MFMLNTNYKWIGIKLFAGYEPITKIIENKILEDLTQVPFFISTSKNSILFKFTKNIGFLSKKYTDKNTN